MKKALPILMLFMAISFVGFSQYYYLPWINAGTNPGGLNNDAEQPATAGWTAICNPSATPIWSSTVTIPFTFNFNGAPVTQYKVSTSGILTFTTSAGTAPSSTSATIPNAAIPNNSVCVWGLSGFGANDSIKTKTFGTSPNRQHWVQFVSYDCPSATGWTYWSFVLEETTNKIYIVDHRSYNAPLALTLGIQINSTTAIQVTGSPTIGSNATTTADPSPVDNTYYEFIYGTQPANSVALLNIAPTTGTSASYAVVPGNITITGNVKNIGSTGIAANGLTIKYNDGVSTVSYVYPNAVASMANAAFTIPTAYAPAAGPHNMKVWVELTGDSNHNDDTLATVLTGADFMPVHKVTFEEETGTWCGWCVRGFVFLDSIAHSSYGANCELIAVHDADPMTVTAYDAGATTMPGFSGFPSIEVDRKVIDDPSYIFDEYTAHIGDFGIADITVTPSFNWATRALTVSAAAHFAVPVAPATGAYNLALVIVEDSVHNTSGGTWDQHNYYSFQSQNIALSGAGHNFQTDPQVIPSAQMWYNYVGEAILGSYTGTSGSIPVTVVSGATQNYTFPAYSVPAGSNPVHMRAIVMLINTTTGQIVNSNHGVLSPTGVTEISNSVAGFNVYPNPFSTTSNVNFNLKNESNVTVTVGDVLGQTVMNVFSGTMAQGDHSIAVNGTNLPAGIYFVTLKAGENTMTQKISIIK